MNKLYSSRRGGFTLIETLVSLTIFTLLVFTVLSVYQHGVVQWRKSERVMDVQDNLRAGLDRMAREIRQAGALGSGSGTRKIIFYNTEGEKIVYSKSNHTLYRRAGDSVKQPVADYVTELNFEYDPGGLVTVSIGGKAGSSELICYTTAVGLRAGSESDL